MFYNLWINCQPETIKIKSFRECKNVLLVYKVIWYNYLSLENCSAQHPPYWIILVAIKEFKYSVLAMAYKIRI